MTQSTRSASNSMFETLKLLTVTAVLGSLLFVSTAVFPEEASAQSVPHEEAFIASVNNVRASVGLPALILESQLTTASRGWARQQADLNCPNPAPPDGSIYICHAPNIAEGISYRYAKVGENVGTGPTVEGIMEAFVLSPTHYANIIDPTFTHIGVGVVSAPGRLTTTHRFMSLQPGATLNDVQTPPAPIAATATTTSTVAPSTAPPTTAVPTTTPPTTAAPTTEAPNTTTPTAGNQTTVDPTTEATQSLATPATVAPNATTESDRASTSVLNNVGDRDESTEAQSGSATTDDPPESLASTEGIDSTVDLVDLAEGDAAAGAETVTTEVNIGTARVTALLGALDASQ